MNSMSNEITNILLSPLLSEKSNRVAEKNRQIVFKVRKQASKNQVKNAVEAMFDVKVSSVNLLNASLMMS